MAVAPPSRAKGRGFRRLARIYLHHLARDPRRERLFLASLAFVVTFGLIRGLVYSIRYNIGPFHNVSVGGTHVHHLVWGILLLLVTGYASLVEFGTRRSAYNALSRLTAVGFGVGAALAEPVAAAPSPVLLLRRSDPPGVLGLRPGPAVGPPQGDRRARQDTLAARWMYSASASLILPADSTPSMPPWRRIIAAAVFS